MIKYYTPDISEFHVGFEYEYLYGFKDNEIWKKSKCTKSDFRHLEHELANRRVKYLDKADIEECGFKCDAPGNFSKGDLVLLYFNQETKSRGFCLFINDYGNVPEGFIYTPIISANIKNKSELKKLLKQLNI